MSVLDATSPVAALALQLARDRVPFVEATVVRAVRPTSAHAGDVALVRADGGVEGFVGGSCAEEAVRTHALAALDSGEPLLLRIEAGAAATTLQEGVVTVSNPCVSGGSVEVFLQPRRPRPRLVVVGTTPVARALGELGAPLGVQVEAATGTTDWEGADAVVVASHGREEEPALEAALRAGVPYVGLVASRARAAAVLASLDVDDTSRVHSPAGLDLGGRTAPEVALSILAEVVAVRAGKHLAVVGEVSAVPAALPSTAPAESPAGPPSAVDPVCGMTVTLTADTLRAERDGVEHAFCSERCRRALLGAPGAGSR